MTGIKIQVATFGAGCFWQLEDIVRRIPGVISTSVGYMGGKIKNLADAQIYESDTGHAEVTQIIFDPRRIDYKNLLTVFWENHDPTTLNRQGPDHGTQYRSVIFYHTAQQKKAAIQSEKLLAETNTWDKPIVTTIEKAQKFFKAAEYHQHYLQKRGLASCHIEQLHSP